MTWQSVATQWLTQAAVGGLIVLVLGGLATRLCRQPVRKARLAALTLACALVVPWLGALPLGPKWSPPLIPQVASAGPIADAPAAATVDERSEAGSASVPTLSESRVIERPSRSIKAHVARGPVVVANELTAAPVVSRRAVGPVLPAFLTLYVSATAGLVAWWLLGQAMLFRICRHARPVPGDVRSAFLTLSGPAGARVRLLESDLIALPFTFTWATPTILLPSDLAREGDSDELRYCLAHEWSHVERHDSWTWSLAAVAGFALFYQPLYWWLRRQLRLCQDFLADDRAAALGSPEGYASYLVRLARCRKAGPALPALGIGDRRSNLHRRIVMLVEDRAPLERHCRTIWSIAAALAASAAVVVASGLRLDAAPPQDKPVPKVEAKPTDKDKPTPKAETLKYSGVVKDKDSGKPIDGAKVIVRRSILKAGGDNRVLQETKHTTDASGKYDFTIPPEQVAENSLYIELDVEHPDYATQAGFGYALGMIRKNETIGGRPFFENVELRPGKPVTGRVQTAEGGPAKGVEVLAYSVTTKTKNTQMEYGSFFKTKTDDQGKFRAVLTTPGMGVFWLLPADAAPETHRVPDDKRGDLGLFVLKKGVPIKGRVLDSRGKPVAGVFVNCEHERDANDSSLEGLMVADAINRSAETDADGNFALAPLPAGNYRVQPGVNSRTASGDREKRTLPAVFVAQKLTIKEGEAPEPLVVRASPHVVIEAQWLDGKGKPTWGFEHHIFGRIDGTFWFGEAKPDDKGKVVALIPHGLEDVQFNLMTNEHHAIQYRLKKDAPLTAARQIRLGTMDHDVKGIEIVHYNAPILMVKGETTDHKTVPGLIVSADYVVPDSGPNMGGKMILRSGVQSDVSFEAQEDGRHRSSQLVPDREVTVTAQAEGFKPRTAKVKLGEGETKDVVLTLSPK